MSKLNGGYVMIDLNDNDNIYAKAKKAIGCGKPIMVYDDPECYYADSISLNGDGDVVIVKGGKTINITDANSVISEGIVSNPTLETIKDIAGNLRFIEGEGTEPAIPGVTISYLKWSLSGTHLMMVLSGKIDNGTSITAGVFGRFAIPSWILDKIYPVEGTFIENKQIAIYGTDYTTQTLSVSLNKASTNLYLNVASITLTADRSFRIQFDLLIDQE